MKKLLAVAIILLFIGISVIPSTGIVVVKKSTMPTFYDGNILCVGGSGPGNYTRIQDAIDNAIDGDTVFVYDDSSPYRENLLVDKSINLIGEDRNTTIIDGNESGDVLYISADGVNISGFTIKNCGTENHDAGISVLSDYNTIAGNIITNEGEGGPFDYGDGLFFNSSSNNTVTENVISKSREYAIFFRTLDNDNNTIRGNTLSNNYGGVFITEGRFNNICDNRLAGNKFGIGVRGPDNTILANHILSIGFLGLSIMDQCNVSRNTIENGIIGMAIYGCSNNISHNNVSNHASEAIDLRDGPNNIITNNHISNNNMGIRGYSFNKNTITSNVISNNKWGIRGDFFYNNTICYNNFIDNKIHVIIYQPRGSQDPLLKNIWSRNYWDHRRLPLPKPVLCLKQIYGPFYLPGFQFDWHPALKPYDI